MHKPFIPAAHPIFVTNYCITHHVRCADVAIFFILARGQNYEKDSDEKSSGWLLYGILLAVLGVLVILILLSLVFIFKKVRNKRRRKEGLTVIAFSVIRFKILQLSV